MAGRQEGAREEVLQEVVGPGSGAGIVALVFAVVEHLKVSRKLWELGLPIPSRLSLPVGSTMMLLVIGIVLLASVILN